jgi:hypothetical protein
MNLPPIDRKRLEAMAHNAIAHHPELVYTIRRLIKIAVKAGIKPDDSDIVQAERVLKKTENL